MKGDNHMKIKFKKEKVLSIAVMILGIVVTILSNKVSENEQKAMKEELKEELIKELSSNRK